MLIIMSVTDNLEDSVQQTALLTQWKWKHISRNEERKGKKALFLICFNKLPFKIVVAVTLSFGFYKFLLPGLEGH